MNFHLSLGLSHDQFKLQDRALSLMCKEFVVATRKIEKNECSGDFFFYYKIRGKWL